MSAILAAVFPIWIGWRLMLTAAAVVVLWYLFHRRHPALAAIPGPAPLPLIGNSLVYIFGGTEVLIPLMKKYRQRYGGIFVGRMGCSSKDDMVFISKPEYLQKLYTSKVNLDRADHYQNLTPIMGHGLFVANGARWKALRTAAMASFFGLPAEQLLEPILGEVQPLLADLRSYAEGHVIPAEHPLQQAAFRSIHLSLTGKSMPPALSHASKKVDFLMKVSFEKIFRIFYMIKPIFNLSPVGKSFNRDANTFWHSMEASISAALKQLKVTEANCQQVPKIYLDRMTEFPIIDKQTLIEECAMMFVAGGDTTMSTMAFLLTCLGLYPEVQQKVYEEDREVQKMVGGGQMTLDHLKNYQYLDRVIKETLRMFPVGPILGRKLSEDTRFGEFLVPKGTNVAVLQIVTNHSEDIFPEPMKFDPDRFLPENISSIPPYAFNPFSAGPRGCPGARYAYMTMKALVPAVIREFIIESAYSSIEEALSNAHVEFTLMDRNHSPIRLRPRQTPHTKNVLIT